MKHPLPIPLARTMLRMVCFLPALRRLIAPAALCAFAMLATALSAATINVWYGDTQTFGALGVPQKWVNILGNVTEPTTVTSLSYSLNGGASRALSMGPDTRRLQNPGDFNVDLSIDDLLDGSNTVVITAQTNSQTTTKTVTVEFHRDRIWPSTYNVTWGNVVKLQDAVQVVDGRWSFSAAGARPVEWGYDRVLAVGDILWSDYEITVPVTIHAIDSSSKAYNSVSISPGLGIVMRWYGHEDWGTSLKGPWQPVIGWEPLGANIWYDWKNSGLLFIAGEDGLYQADPANRKLVIGNTYFFKMRVETMSSGGGMYRAKMWQAGQPEPATWEMSGQEGSGDIPGGSLLLIAHHIDATFGNFSIVPLNTGSPGDTTPPVISNVQNTIGTTTANISWTTNETTVGAVTYNHGYREEFNGTALDPATWTFVNPLGDGTISVANGQLSLSVPAGTNHDIWTGDYSVPRAMRPAANKDFDLQVRLNSPVTQLYQQQGLVIEQDSNNLIRVETHYNGSATKVYAASIVGGKATTRLAKTVSGAVPVYLRVQRVGNQWTVYHSYNGTSWTNDKTFTLPFTVKATGVYVGNSGGFAHTAVVDFVSGSAATDVASSGSGTQHSASLTGLTPSTTYQYWVSATDLAGNSSVSPEYQFTTLSETPQSFTLSTTVVGTGSVSRSPDQSTYDGGTVVQLSATAAAGWTFAGWSGDLSGTSNPASVTMTSNKSITANFTTAPPPEKKTLTVNVQGSGTVSRQPDQAEYDVGQVVQLVATASSGWTFAGWSGDITGTANPVSLTISTNHVVTATFSQLGDTTPPVISNLQASAGSTSASVGWTTNEPATGSVSYNYALQEEFDGTALNQNAWTFINPLGDGTMSVSGGKISLSVPAGTDHDVWTGMYTVPRIMRATPNKDFSLQAKFDSSVSAAYQQQGLLIEQDSANLIRVEIFHDGSSRRLFAATIAGGTATSRIYKSITISTPGYLRVTRAGNQWTVSYSSNGTSWTTGGTFTHALTVASSGTYVGNGTAAHTTIVDWLTGTWASDTASVPSGTQHTANLAGLIPASTYRYRVSATDAAGNTTTAPEAQFATGTAGGP